ncbi:unnamed protein product [Linum trigynum]|uniref:Uncharacterized protein n=1 Tax=Linum trigynum TaxID=586398 RepID=A0AAV2EQD6_9ROSI
MDRPNPGEIPFGRLPNHVSARLTACEVSGVRDCCPPSGLQMARDDKERASSSDEKRIDGALGIALLFADNDCVRETTGTPEPRSTSGNKEFNRRSTSQAST